MEKNLEIGTRREAPGPQQAPQAGRHPAGESESEEHHLIFLARRLRLHRFEEQRPGEVELPESPILHHFLWIKQDATNQRTAFGDAGARQQEDARRQTRSIREGAV